MGAVSTKLRNVEGGAFGHWCPGCAEMHVIHVGRPNFCGAQWSFDGDVDRPTFSPSINIHTEAYIEDGIVVMPEERCHYFLKGGLLQFLGDCTHALAGQTHPLPYLPADYLE